MIYHVKGHIITQRDPVEIVKTAIQPLLRNNEAVNATVTSVDGFCNYVLIALDVIKSIHHPEDWANQSIRDQLKLGESTGRWIYETPKPTQEN